MKVLDWLCGGGVRTLDLFCGAGGLSLGFAAAGFDIEMGVDIDLDSLTSFAWAHPMSILRCMPVQEFMTELSFDVVIGGPPCQPWSTGGKQLGAADARDGWPAFLQVVRKVQPVAFVAENVPGFFTAPDFERVLGELAVVTPFIAAKILDAADFGVPQHRRRLFIVGTPKRFEWPTPVQHRAAGEVIGVEPVGEPNPAKVTYARHPDLRPDPYHGHLVNGGGRPLDLSRPAPTVLASASGNKAPWVDTLGIIPEYHAHLRAGGAPRSGVVPGARRLTAVELALLQSFEPAHRFFGVRTSQVRQIGNAVPPLLAQRIAEQVARTLTMEAAA